MNEEVVKIDFQVLNQVMEKLCALPYREVHVLVSNVRASVVLHNPAPEGATSQTPDAAETVK